MWGGPAHSSSTSWGAHKGRCWRGPWGPNHCNLAPQLHHWTPRQTSSRHCPADGRSLPHEPFMQILWGILPKWSEFCGLPKQSGLCGLTERNGADSVGSQNGAHSVSSRERSTLCELTRTEQILWAHGTEQILRAPETEQILWAPETEQILWAHGTERNLWAHPEMKILSSFTQPRRCSPQYTIR